MGWGKRSQISLRCGQIRSHGLQKCRSRVGVKSGGVETRTSDELLPTWKRPGGRERLVTEQCLHAHGTIIINSRPCETDYSLPSSEKCVWQFMYLV